MAKVYMTCGRICSGKSTYAKALSKEKKAVILSVDDITLALFGQQAGDKLDEYVERCERYFFDKSLEIVSLGINVILDWGFWTKRERSYAKGFYAANGVECEFHYIDIPDDEWKRRIDKRNKQTGRDGKCAYYVDEGLAKKADSIFERPDKSEIDVHIKWGDK